MARPIPRTAAGRLTPGPRPAWGGIGLSHQGGDGAWRLRGFYLLVVGCQAHPAYARFARLCRASLARRRTLSLSSVFWQARRLGRSTALSGGLLVLGSQPATSSLATFLAWLRHAGGGERQRSWARKGVLAGKLSPASARGECWPAPTQLKDVGWGTRVLTESGNIVGWAARARLTRSARG